MATDMRTPSTEMVVQPESPPAVRTTLRFFANELRVTFFRRRNQLLLLVAALFPLLIGIGLKLSAPHADGGGRGPGSSGAAYFSQLAGQRRVPHLRRAHRCC